MLHEFSVKPDIIVVWGSPEHGKLWFFEDLLKQNKIQHLLIREKTPEDGILKHTTYMESLNFETAFNFITKNYQNYYIVGQAADIFVKENIYRQIDLYMQQKNDGVFFPKKFPTLTSAAPATNLFAVSSNFLYFPPYQIKKKSGNVMEHNWLLSIQDNKLKNYKMMKDGCYHHIHETEHLGQPPNRFQKIYENISLCVVGYKPLRFYVKNIHKEIWLWLKLLWNMIV